MHIRTFFCELLHQKARRAIYKNVIFKEVNIYQIAHCIDLVVYMTGNVLEQETPTVRIANKTTLHIRYPIQQKHVGQ